VVPGPVAPTVMQINIDIKPGERIALIHPKSKGRIPVALLSSGTFNALDVDVKSITFGATGNEASLKGCERRGERVDRNRQRDLVCHFETEDAGFATGSLQGVLRGKTRDGRAFEGRGSVKVVQHHDRHHRDRDDDRRGDRDDRHDNRRGHR
jgi:hypothetical protein